MNANDTQSNAGIILCEAVIALGAVILIFPWFGLLDLRRILIFAVSFATAHLVLSCWLLRKRGEVKGRGRWLYFQIVQDSRLQWMIWLVSAATIASLGWWYPYWVAERNAAPDDRFGVVFAFVSLPFSIIGAVIAVTGIYQLTRLAFRSATITNILSAAAGIVLGLYAISPTSVLGWRLLGFSFFERK